MQFVVRDRNSEARAEHAQLVVIQLFLLVGDVLAFAGFAQTVALDGLGQDDGGRALVLDRGFVSGMDLDGIVAAQAHAGQLLVGEVLHHLEQARIGAEEVLAEVGAAFDEVFLILAVADLAHAPDQQPVAIVADEAVPVAAPDDLDDVPARAAENGFQFLNDLAVAAHRPVQALQIAVDDEDQVVEPFARGQGDGAERFGFVHFAVAQEGPDLAAGGLLQAAVFQIAHEARLVDGLDGPEAHRDGGKFPEIRHEPGMWIGGKAASRFQFAAEVLQLLLGDAAFKIGAGIDSRRGMSLKINQVAIASFGPGVQEMVEGDFVKVAAEA